MPAQRLAETDRDLLATPLPSLRKVDKRSVLRPVRSARYPVPKRMLGNTLQILANPAGGGILIPGIVEDLAGTLWWHPGK
ncbi:MAG: hypothetical protein ABI807_07110 [Sporichthyaceae bacterium]